MQPTNACHAIATHALRRTVAAWFVASLAAAMAVMAALAPASGLAQTVTPAAAPPPTVANPPATLRYFNRDIVVLRVPFFGNSPERRARVAEANIARIIDEPGLATVSYEVVPQGVAILMSGQLVTVLVPGDRDALHGQTLDQLRAQTVSRLSAAAVAAEQARLPQRIVEGLFWIAVATVAAIGVLWLLRKLVLRVRHRADAWVARRLSQLKSEPARQMLSGLIASARGLARLATWVIVLLTFEEWLRFALGRFPYTQPWANAMTQWIGARTVGFGHAILGALPGLFSALLIFLLARLVTQAVRVTFHGVESGRFQLLGVDQQLAEPTRKIITVLIWLFALAMAYPYLPGAETEAFKGLSVFVGLMVSLGASSIVGQAAGGFTLLYSRTMTPGDVVRIGETEGTVQQIGLFTTRLRTPLGVEVSFPNNVVLGGMLQNLSRNPDGPGMWIEAKVTIGYDAPWRQVHRLLLDAARRTPNVQSTPAPFVAQTALSDFYVEYALRARIADVQQRLIARSTLHANIQDAFNEAGVQIMSPNYEADPESPKIVPKSRWEGHESLSAPADGREDAPA
ncbi:mechanosensitive ion channel family protein [Lysobacter arvi]|uniref:Small-conductance mechanosensitive channel n=1 Tax=Lysobacter arvi TaxID=3038776 RepID=A0ABU1CDK6_9GAMM|nr:mechanosensitive ion channel family protein [Lysobacter arvi]MDR0182122.1 mechanosensitive ion channel family protein [Lysobacter arvi]